MQVGHLNFFKNLKNYSTLNNMMNILVQYHTTSNTLYTDAFAFTKILQTNISDMNIIDSFDVMQNHSSMLYLDYLDDIIQQYHLFYVYLYILYISNMIYFHYT